MKRTTLTLSSVGIAGLVTTGLLALPISSAFADDDTAIKRDEDTPDVVLVADEDDDDTADRMAGTNSGGDTNSRSRDTSGVNSGDGTNSRSTAVSRDRDRSRGDKTRDFTRDGAGDDRSRDWSANRTNDRSRNDTRR